MTSNPYLASFFGTPIDQDSLTGAERYLSPDGDKVWYLNNRAHSETQPACVTKKGDEIWYKDGKRHRLNGPAVVYKSGRLEWWQDGKVHRGDGPAVIVSEPNFQLREWWRNGHRHRENGPAIVRATELKVTLWSAEIPGFRKAYHFYLNDKVIDFDEVKSWCEVTGLKIQEEDWPPEEALQFQITFG